MRDFYILLGAIFVLVSSVWLYNYLKERKIEELKKLSYKVYLFEKGKISEKEILKEVKGTPFYPYILAKLGRYEEAYKSIEDKDFKKFFKERTLVDKYLSGKYEEVLKEEEHFTEKDFNYPSFKSLEAFSYQKLGKNEKAISIWSGIKEKYPSTYFSNLAEIELFLLKGADK
ncbi:hypothetical protein JCM9492_15840 [Aquifex pyrophilus]